MVELREIYGLLKFWMSAVTVLRKERCILKNSEENPKNKLSKKEQIAELKAQLKESERVKMVAEKQYALLEEKLRQVQVFLCRGQISTAALALNTLENMDKHIKRPSVEAEFLRLRKEAKEDDAKDKKA